MRSWHDLRSLCDELRRNPSHCEPLLLNFEGLQVAVHSGSPVLLERLSEYFAPFLLKEVPVGRSATRIFAVEQEPPALDLAFETWPREPGKERLKEEVATEEELLVVRKVRTGMQFICTESDQFAFGPCLANINQVINFVGSRFMTHYMHRGWQLCHAAGVANGVGGLAIAGVSGGGKSTLALHLITSGLDYVSNDRLLIQANEESVEMLGVPKLPRINPGTAMNNHRLAGILPADRLEHFKKLDSHQLWNLEEKYDVDINRCFGEDRMQKRTELRGIVILNWSRELQQRAQLKQVTLHERPELMRALTKAAGPFYQPGGSGPTDGQSIREDSYLRVLQRIPVFEMTGGVDFAGAVHKCTNLLLEGAALRV